MWVFRRISIWTVSSKPCCLLCWTLNWFMSCLGRATCTVHSRPARKEIKVTMLKSSWKLTVLIYILCLWFIINVCRVNFLAHTLHENGSSFDSSLQSIFSGSILFKVCCIEIELLMGEVSFWIPFFSVFSFVLTMVSIIVTLFRAV